MFCTRLLDISEIIIKVFGLIFCISLDLNKNLTLRK